MPGLIPERFIDELLARVDIVDVMQPRVPLKREGRGWTACCPFHNERTPSFHALVFPVAPHSAVDVAAAVLL